MQTKPFDLELARNGAQVITADGDAVKIVNFDLAVVPSYPILGIITKDLPHGSFEVYEVWPKSGSYDEIDQVGLGRTPPPDLLIVDESPQDNLRDQMIERLEGELEASRHNYQAATLEIKRLADKLDKCQGDRNRLEIWRDQALETIKAWGKVEAWIAQDCKTHDDTDGLAGVVIERLETLKGLKKLLDDFKG